LISPTIVLTAAHCVDGIDSVSVTFDPAPLPLSSSGSISGLIDGTAHPNPEYSLDLHSAKAFYDMSQFDIAVIELDQSPGISPAPLPEQNLLRPFRTGTRNRTFPVVGYGTFRDIEPPRGHELQFDGVRRVTTVPLKKLTDTLLYVQLNSSDNRGGGGGCFGDSGGPVFLGTTVVGEYTGVQGGLCQTFGSYTRIDTGPARAFLDQYVALP
jgi:hypothetical protein